MIEMTRLRLVNWHNFQDECIPFRMVTYLIGVNAVGKTTIMDAIRYCLTTNKNFNAAGNRLSGRTLQGSVHGKQRGENIYLRPGHTVAYVGVEFTDHEKKAPFVIAVRVESESPSQEFRHVAQDWFITKSGFQLENLLFVDKDRRPTKKETFKASCPGMKAPLTQKIARADICRILGIGDSESSLGKKFNEVFHMGTSLKEISDIRNFIYTYILPEPEIRVEALQSDMRELEHLEETLCEARKREQVLDKIVECGKQATELETQVQINEGFILLARMKKVLGLEEQYRRICEEADHTLEHLKPQLESLKEKKQRAQDALLIAMQDKEGDKQVQASKFYREQEKELSAEYRAQVHRQQDWYSSLDQLKKLLNRVYSAGLGGTVSIFPEDFCDWSKEQQEETLVKLDREIESIGQEIEDRKYTCRKESEDLKVSKEAYTREIRTLRSGKMSFPAASEQLRDRINEELQRRGMDPDAKILCELLYMEDVNWQECAEAALGFRRFDIIVPSAHYFPAKRVFASLGDQVGDVSLVDTVGLDRDSSQWQAPAQNMLAYKIGSENHYVRQYVNYLLHGIICCDSEDDLEQYPRSVTQKLLRHQGYRLQRMHRPILYIGAEARKQRCESLEATLRKNTEQQLSLGTQMKLLLDLNEAHSRFVHEKHTSCLKSNLDAREQVETLNTKLNSVRKELREFETNPILAALFDRCACCEKACNEIDKEINDQTKKIWEQEKIVEDAQKHMTQNVSDVETAQAEQNQFLLQHSELAETLTSRYAEASRSKTPADIERNQMNYRAQCLKALDDYITTELKPIQKEYNATYAVDYSMGLNGLELYRSAHEELVHIELERSLENLRKAQIRCKERFRKEILFRMKDDIRNAKLQFRELDRVMSELTYGEEKYHFVINGHHDKELQDFYRIIMDENNDQITEQDSLFTREAMSHPAYEIQVDELMAKIMADVNAAAQDRSAGKKYVSDQISKYVDYRTYLEYDIIVENAVTKMSVPLSQVSGDSSGGENQAPFYVAICASLLQIYRQSPNSIRLILLDEAFNNMTSDRIEPMMKMFAASQLQLVLISTVEKCSAIYPYCDMVYSIIKSGSRAALAPFEKLYEGND